MIERNHDPFQNTQCNEMRFGRGEVTGGVNLYLIKVNGNLNYEHGN
jgi:hypothetical protein